MTVIGFVGKPRTGKTLFMTFNAYPKLFEKIPYTIYSNYKLMFPHTMISPYDMLKIPFTDVDRNPKCLMIQEADKWFDSRRSGRNENVLLSSLTGQSGKRNLDIFFDTQFWNRIDASLRDVTEIVFHANVYVDARTKIPLAFQFGIEDVYNGEIGINIRKLPIIPAPILAPFYSMYNSYEATQPMTVGKKMKELKEMYQPE